MTRYSLEYTDLAVIDMFSVTALLAGAWGLAFVFLNVLLEQAGLPIPAVPTLVLAGALAAKRPEWGLAAFALALAACVITDVAWYGAGRAYAIEAATEVVVYCSCPNEASAARVAQLLMRHGVVRVRPLLGGLDAWAAAGYLVTDTALAPAAEGRSLASS